MLNQLFEIANFMLNAFWEVWPYLLVTIPLAVAVNMSGASKYINRAFQAGPIIAIFLATAVGAFSPFCSCSVIPIVAALLIGGVPLAPVMAFWIASPSMDPEIFFLSVATIGWELAVWRLVATLLLSLSAGLVTHLVMQRGWLGHNILRVQQPPSLQSAWAIVRQGWRHLKAYLSPAPALGFSAFSNPAPAPAAESACCASDEISLSDHWQPVAVATPALVASAEATNNPSSGVQNALSPGVQNAFWTSDLPLAGPTTGVASDCGCGSSDDEAPGDSCSIQSASFRQRLFKETGAATLMVVKFMALAYFLEALIILYVPADWIAGLLGGRNSLAILWAALIGIPVYTSSLTALPLIGGLLAQGMHPGAALAFLIAGPTTTLPAMAAVWGLVNHRVFGLYVAFSLVGAVLVGYGYGLVM